MCVFVLLCVLMLIANFILKNRKSVKRDVELSYRRKITRKIQKGGGGEEKEVKSKRREEKMSYMKKRRGGENKERGGEENMFVHNI